jgi:hypothetical protein
MSRSRHTDPPRVRAPRRVRAPYAGRGEGDARTARRLGRVLKELGVAARPAPVRAERAGAAPLPRIRVVRAAPGRAHAVTAGDVGGVLRQLGERYTYGLRSVELVPAPAHAAPGRLALGRLIVPGRILLYDQPEPPWRLPGLLGPEEQARLRAAGALVDLDEPGGWTGVAWPGTTLRDFVLFDVLVHELAHHALQQYTGKRGVRIARRRDHEAFARALVDRCRAERPVHRAG